MKSANSTRPSRVWLRMVGLVLAALLLFGLSAFLCAAVISGLTATPLVASLAVLSGLIVWLFLAVFHFRRETIVLAFEDRGGFLHQLRCELMDLGYETAGSELVACTYRPNFMALLMGGSLHVAPGAEFVTLTGPKVCLENVRRRLRLNNHVKKVRSSSSSIHLPKIATAVATVTE